MSKEVKQSGNEGVRPTVATRERREGLDDANRVLQGRWQALRDAGEPPFPALQQAIDAVFDARIGDISGRGKLAADMREIWLMQPRFERRTVNGANALVAQPRFRAGYDFLRLRADCGEQPAELAEWWEDFHLGSDEDREAMLQDLRAASHGRTRRVPRAGACCAGARSPQRITQPFTIPVIPQHTAPRTRSPAALRAVNRRELSAVSHWASADPPSSTRRRPAAVSASRTRRSPAGTPLHSTNSTTLTLPTSATVAAICPASRQRAARSWASRTNASAAVSPIRRQRSARRKRAQGDRESRARRRSSTAGRELGAPEREGGVGGGAARRHARRVALEAPLGGRARRAAAQALAAPRPAVLARVDLLVVQARELGVAAGPALGELSRAPTARPRSSAP